MPACGHCGQDNPEIARFCLACGAPLAAPAGRREVRKTVTVVFADVTGSTALGERLDPESLRRVLARCFDELAAVVKRHGGTVEKFIGDAIMAVFGVPLVHEDDALRAVRAASQMRERANALAADIEQQLGVRVAFRIGVNTGEVVAGEGADEQRIATGDAVNVAARLEQAADPGQILLGAPTYELVRDAVVCEPVDPLALKGKAEPVPAYRLVEVRSDELGHARRLDSPLVGREHERRLLDNAFERATREQACHLFTVLGTAGVGKSRLVLEFLASVGDRADVVRGRCLPYGEGITYWPLAEALGEAAGLTTSDAPEEALLKLGTLVYAEPDRELIAARVAEALGVLDPAGSREEIFWAARKLFETCARRRPLVAVFDDLHWAEETFLDLVEHLGDWSRDAPILLLCIARPELLDSRPHWSGGKLNATTVLVEPLSEGESAELIENLLGRARLDEAARRRIAQAAEGNPLFVEEMLAMLIDDGLLVRVDGQWHASDELAAVPIPPTIQALLAARLDRLNGDERAAIERAAVEGKVFHLGAVAELSADAVRPTVGASLMSLVRKELVRPNQPQLAGEDAFRFRHLLIRDAAYEAISKELRAELHERFALWLDGKAQETATEFDEIVGWHLEQAVDYRMQLGQRDERTAELASRAASHLHRAALRATVHDQPAGVALLGRVVELLPDDDLGRIEALVDLGEALTNQFDFARGETLLGEARSRARTLGDRRLDLHAALVLGQLRISTDPEGSTDSLRAAAEDALPVFEELGDDRGLCRAWSAFAAVHHMANRRTEHDVAVERAREYARRAGDVAAQSRLLPPLVMSVTLGPTPVEDALVRLDAIRAEGGGARPVEVAYGALRALLEAWRGDIDAARTLYGRALATAEEFAVPFAVVAVSEWACVAELVAGDPARAESEMRRGYELLEQAGEKGYLSTMACHLADAVERQGRDGEAYRLTELAEELGAADDTMTQFSWRQLRARILAKRGELELAERLAREAAALVEVTDEPAFYGDALVDLALVLRAAGREGEAVEALERARELYAQKGATALVERTDGLLAVTA